MIESDEKVLELLRDSQRDRLDERELHQLRVLYRHRGPQRSGMREWLAVLRPEYQAEVAVRGPRQTRLLEYEAERLRIVLELRPGSNGTCTHGQIVSDDGSSVGPGDVAAVGERGVLAVELDEFGEFALPELAPGCYRLTCCLEQGRVVLPELELVGGEL